MRSAGSGLLPVIMDTPARIARYTYVAHFPTRAINRLIRMRVEIHHIALRETMSQHAVLLKRIAQYGLVITPAVMLCGNFILLAFDDFV
ncbi:MAG: hypothetical protein SOX90_11095, partial [Candidatus Fimadaptatus sp.]|nr:hypothetical protein [Candidatus Fimadaptatus sp.]